LRGACVMELADDAGAISNDECRNPKDRCIWKLFFTFDLSAAMLGQ